LFKTFSNSIKQFRANHFVRRASKNLLPLTPSIFARESKSVASPAACSFRAEPSKILFSFLEEFFGGARKSEIVKSILLGGER